MTAPLPILTKLKTHDAMAKFLIGLCRLSDVQWKGQRTADTNERYKRARQLIEQAGFKYKPKKQP
jgi:hypothetical protein